MIREGGVDVGGELRREGECELLTSPFTGADWRRMEVSAGIEVDKHLVRKLVGGTLGGCVSFTPTLWGVTVVALLSTLISEAFEMVLVLEKIVATPVAEERREMREGVSDCVEDCFKDIIDNS
jgi:hypothetical protein